MRSPAIPECAPRTSPSLKAMPRSTPPTATVSRPESRDWWMKATKSAMGNAERSPAITQRGRGPAPPAAGVRRPTRRSGAEGRRRNRPARSASARRASSSSGTTRPCGSMSTSWDKLVPRPAAVALPLLLVLEGEAQRVPDVLRRGREHEAPPVEVHGGRAHQAGAAGLCLRRGDARLVAALLQRLAQVVRIAAERAGVAGEVVVLERVRVLEQLVVHLPEEALVARPLGGGGRLEGDRVAPDGKGLVVELHARLVLADELLQLRAERLAIRAFEVRELDDRDRRVRLAERRPELLHVELGALRAVEAGVVVGEDLQDLAGGHALPGEAHRERRHPRRVLAALVLPQAPRERVRAPAVAELVPRHALHDLDLRRREPREIDAGQRVGGLLRGGAGRSERRGGRERDEGGEGAGVEHGRASGAGNCRGAPPGRQGTG